MPELIIRSSQYYVTDFGCNRMAVDLMRRRYTRNEKPISLHEFREGMSDRITSSTNSNRFHHTGVSQLSTTKSSVEHHRFLVLVWFDTSDEERLATAQCFHQGVQGFLELSGQSRCSFPSL